MPGSGPRSIQLPQAMSLQQVTQSSHIHFYLLALLGADSFPLSLCYPAHSFIAIHTLDVCGSEFLA